MKQNIILLAITWIITENKETLDNKKSGEDSDYDDNDNEELDDIDQYFADYYN